MAKTTSHLSNTDPFLKSGKVIARWPVTFKTLRWMASTILIHNDLKIYKVATQTTRRPQKPLVAGEQRSWNVPQ